MKKNLYLFFSFFYLFVAISATGQNVHTLRIRKPTTTPTDISTNFAAASPTTSPIINNSSPANTPSEVNKLTILNIYPDSSIFLNNNNDGLSRGQGTVYFLTLYPNKNYRYWKKDTCIFTPQELQNYRNSNDSMVICLHFGSTLYNVHRRFSWEKSRIDWFAFDGNQRATQQLIDVAQLYETVDVEKKKSIPKEDKMRVYKVLFKNRKKQTIFSRTFNSNQFDVALIPNFVETVTFINLKSQPPKDAARQVVDETKKNEQLQARQERIKDKKKLIGSKIKKAKNPLRKSLLKMRYKYWANKTTPKATALNNQQIRRRDKKYKIHKLSTFSIPATNLRNFNPNR